MWMWNGRLLWLFTEFVVFNLSLSGWTLRLSARTVPWMPWFIKGKLCKYCCAFPDNAHFQKDMNSLGAERWASAASAHSCSNFCFYFTPNPFWHIWQSQTVVVSERELSPKRLRWGTLRSFPKLNLLAGEKSCSTSVSQHISRSKTIRSLAFRCSHLQYISSLMHQFLFGLHVEKTLSHALQMKLGFYRQANIVFTFVCNCVQFRILLLPLAAK